MTNSETPTEVTLDRVVDSLKRIKIAVHQDPDGDKRAFCLLNGVPFQFDLTNEAIMSVMFTLFQNPLPESDYSKVLSVITSFNAQSAFVHTHVDPLGDTKDLCITGDSPIMIGSGLTDQQLDAQLNNSVALCLRAANYFVKEFGLKLPSTSQD